MKRVIIVSLLLLVASACATQGPANSAQPTNSTANTNASNTQAPKSTESISEADLIAKEKQVWDAIKKKDWDGFSSHLTDDHVYVSSDGVRQGKKTIVDLIKDALNDVNITDISLTDFKTVTLDKDAAIVTYTATSKGTMDGKELPAMPQRNSSVWVNRGGKWLVIFHHDTDVAKATPPASTGTKLTPKPAAGLAEADHVAREKQVWDAINKKDWDSFSNVLADNVIEVEAEGIYDRAGTLNGVKDAGLPEMSLSDLKAIKIDDDAAIVTYTAKPANAKPTDAAMLQSTVWVNRGGKWFAIFHQGTEAKKSESK